MEGLGPNQTSLLERIGHGFEMTSDWLEMDRMERGQVRRMAAIRHGMKHKKKEKPVAPVRPLDTKPRLWIWEGVSSPTLLLQNGIEYTGEYIRSKGFRLPKLQKKEKKDAKSRNF